MRLDTIPDNVKSVIQDQLRNLEREQRSLEFFRSGMGNGFGNLSPDAAFRMLDAVLSVQYTPEALQAFYHETAIQFVLCSEDGRVALEGMRQRIQRKGVCR